MWLTFSQIIRIIIAITLSIVAVRFSFSFDINKFLEDRRKIAENKAKNVCTHLFPYYTNKWEIAWLKSAFLSPAWTTSRVCQKCWLILYDIDEEHEKDKINYYFAHNKEYKKREKNFEKLLKKAWY